MLLCSIGLGQVPNGGKRERRIHPGQEGSSNGGGRERATISNSRNTKRCSARRRHDAMALMETPQSCQIAPARSVEERGVDCQQVGALHGADVLQCAHLAIHGKARLVDFEVMQEKTESLLQAEHSALIAEEGCNLHRDDDANASRGVQKFEYLPLVEECLRFGQVTMPMQAVGSDDLNLQRLDDTTSFQGMESFEEEGSSPGAQDTVGSTIGMPQVEQSSLTTEDCFNLRGDNGANACPVERFGYSPVVEEDLQFSQVVGELQIVDNVDLSLHGEDDTGAFDEEEGFEEEEEGSRDIQVMLEQIQSSAQVQHANLMSDESFNLLPVDDTHGCQREGRFDYTPVVEGHFQFSQVVSGSTEPEGGSRFSHISTALQPVYNMNLNFHGDEAVGPPQGVDSLDYLPEVKESLQFDEVAGGLQVDVDDSSKSDTGSSFRQEDSAGCITQIFPEASRQVESLDYTPVVVEGSHFNQDTLCAADNNVSTESEAGSQTSLVASELQAADNGCLNFHQGRDIGAFQGLESLDYKRALEGGIQCSQVGGTLPAVDNLDAAMATEGGSTLRQEQSSGSVPRLSAEAPRGHAQRSVKHHVGNGAHTTGDIRNHVGAKSAEKLPWEVKSGGPGQEEGGMPLWVKWRGKWQAGIRCCTADCPSTTLKIKPNYSKKKHVVVYFPFGRLFSWVDTQHTCPIYDEPLPLLSGTHVSGREAVKDKSLPRRRMLLKLGGDMLDISDRLHIKAVVESSQNVSVWKNFAKEAAAATKYSELGTLLVRLHLTIAPMFIRPLWVERRYAHWKEDCARAASAASVQKLTKELINAVMWDEVAPLWNAPEQPELDPEWEHWKGDAFEENDSDNDPDTNVSTPTVPKKVVPQERQVSAGVGFKRFKEQARARRKNTDVLENSENKRIKVDSLPSPPTTQPVNANFTHAVTAFRSPLVYPATTVSDQQTLASQALPADHCHEVVFGATVTNPGGDLEAKREGHVLGGPSLTTAITTEDHQLEALKDENKKLPENVMASTSALVAVSDGALAYDSGLCSAFLRKKNRRCHRLAKEESTYCGKHKHLGNPAHDGKDLALEGSLAWESGLCSAYLRNERIRCVHPTKEGSIFCETHVHLVVRRNGVKNGEVMFWARKEQNLNGTGLASPADDARCNGITTRGVQCTHKPKDGTSFCVKHSSQGTIIDIKEDAHAQTLEGSTTVNWRTEPMDWQHTTENRSESTVQVQIGQASIHHALPTTFTLPGTITSSAELMPDENDDVPRKKKLASIFSSKVSVETVQPLSARRQEGHFSKPDEVRPNQGVRCVGRTTRNDGQCSFRARIGYSHCTKHLISIQGRRKVHEEAGHVPDSKGSSSVSCAQDLFEKYLEAAAGIASEAPGSESQKELLNWTRAEAQKDYCTAKELLKLVTMEMSKLQTILQPNEVAEERNMDGKLILANDSSPLLQVPENGKIDAQTEKRKAEDQGAEPEPSLGESRRMKRNRLKQTQEGTEKEAESGKEALLLRMKTAVQTAQIRNLRQLKQSQTRGLYTLTKGGRMVPYDDVESKPGDFPNDAELLNTAQSVCCQSQFLAALHQKFTQLPDQLVVRISQLCSEASIRLEWVAEGYLCPSGCKEFNAAKDIKHRLVCGSVASLNSDGPDLNGKRVEDEFGSCSSTSKDVDCKSTAVILCADLSDGQEAVPIICFVDQDVVSSWNAMHSKDGGSSLDTFKPWDNFNYITKRVLDPSLGLDPENSKVGCSCEESQCSPHGCDHVHIFDNDNLEACDIYGKPMKGRFPYDEQGCIILEEGYLVYECNSSCRCSGTCQNRVLQKGVTVKLEVFKTLHKGWAVRAAQMIPRGTFVCEYVGEVLHDHEANKRGERYDQVGCSYLYDIDAHLDTTGKGGRSKPFVIDATKHGNVARFINHSCAPNLVNYQVLVDSMDCQLAHIGLFASRDINIGEELAYDYRYRLLPGKGCPCHCGAPNCRGRLY